MDQDENDHANNEIVHLPPHVRASLREECALYCWHIGRQVPLPKFLGIVVGIMPRHYRELWEGEE